MKINLHLTIIIKINSKWIKKLTMQPKTIKFLQENIGKTRLDMGFGNDVFDTSLEAQATK